MLCGKLQKQLLAQHLKLCRAVLLRFLLFLPNGAARVLKATEEEELGRSKTENLAFLAFCERWSKNLTPETFCKHHLMKVIHLLTKIHRHMQTSMDLG